MNKDYILDSDLRGLKYDFELIKEECFCRKGFIYKVKRYGLNERDNGYYLDEFEEIKDITCKFCDENYNEFDEIKSTVRDIYYLENRLSNYYYDKEYKKHNAELVKEQNKLMKKHDLAKIKLDKFNITNLPGYVFTKRKWAEYFVENNLTKLNEKECYKQIFYGTDKVGLDIFLNTIGITIEEYNAFLKIETFVLEDDRIEELKNEISDKKRDLLQHKELLKVILDNKDKLKDFNYLEILENLSGELKEEIERIDREIEEELEKNREQWVDEDDNEDDELYDKEDLEYISNRFAAFHVRAALNSILNGDQENKETFIKEYICSVLGEEYAEEDDEYNLDDDNEE